jgi:SNF2 family DNA or RNA helicase
MPDGPSEPSWIDEPNPFLSSLRAGGTGLNLTAASYVVLFDPWWNPAVEAQEIDRTHRSGQDRTVIAYRLIARGTIEEKIWELQQRKAAGGRRTRRRRLRPCPHA